MAFILVGSPLIERIPLAALVGVMFMVVIGTFAWRSFQVMTRVPRSDALVIVLVTIVTVLTDLATAVVIGVVISSLVYAWNASRRMRDTTVNEPSNSDVKVYRVFGPLFFGSVASFTELFNPESDPDTVVIDFMDSRVVDHSGLQAIEALATQYQAHGTTLKLRHLSKDCRDLLNKAGQLVEPDADDPSYGVAVDYDVQMADCTLGISPRRSGAATVGMAETCAGARPSPHRGSQAAPGRNRCPAFRPRFSRRSRSRS